MDRLVREPGGVIIAARLQVKGGSFRDLPLTPELSDSLEGWFAFLESVKGVRLRTGGIDFAGSPLVFPGRDGAPFSNKAFNARLKLACERARVPSFPLIPCGIRPPRSFSTSAEPTCATCRRSWAIRVSQQPRATRTSIASGCDGRGKPAVALVAVFFSQSQFDQSEKGWGDRRQGGRATPLRDGKEFHGRRAARKSAGILPAEVRPELRAVAALDNVKLITALISFNWISPLSVFSCGFSMGWFPCLRPGSKTGAGHLREVNRALRAGAFK
jgi:hypothetical protein